ncbi:MAG: hypothetical protein WEB53_04810 [Akkermansiaceae bacterium]|jgi:hypothetical protein
MNYRPLISSVLIAGLFSSLTSCGSSTKVENVNQRSVGQQLTDLEQARQQGIITEREYSRLKKAIIHKND